LKSLPTIRRELADVERHRRGSLENQARARADRESFFALALNIGFFLCYFRRRVESVGYDRPRSHTPAGDLIWRKRMQHRPSLKFSLPFRRKQSSLRSRSEPCLTRFPALSRRVCAVTGCSLCPDY